MYWLLTCILQKGESQTPVIYDKKQRFVDIFVIRNITAEIEELTCHKYGNPKNKYNNVLKAEFDKKSKPKPGKNSLDCIESVDPTTLPPYSKVLLQLI